MNIFDKIVRAVEKHGPLKATELPVKLVEESGEDAFHEWAQEWNVEHGLIEQLVREGRLIEVEYVLPDTGRVKSMLFPAGTDVQVNSRRWGSADQR